MVSTEGGVYRSIYNPGLQQLNFVKRCRLNVDMETALKVTSIF